METVSIAVVAIVAYELLRRFVVNPIWNFFQDRADLELSIVNEREKSNYLQKQLNEVNAMYNYAKRNSPGEVEFIDSGHARFVLVRGAVFNSTDAARVAKKVEARSIDGFFVTMSLFDQGSVDASIEMLSIVSRCIKNRNQSPNQ